MSDHFNTHAAPNDDSLYDATRTRLQNGEQPLSVVRSLIASGLPPSEATRLLQQIHHRLATDRAAVQRAATAEMHRRVAGMIMANCSDSHILRSLVGMGVAAEDGMALMEAARHAGLKIQQRRQRQRRLIMLPAALILGMILLQSVRLHPSRTAGSTAWRVGRMEPTLMVSMQRYNGEVLAKRLSVRQGPGTDFPLIYELKQLDKIHIIGRAAHVPRYKILLPDAREGWIRSDATAVRIHTPAQHIPIVEFSR